MTRPVLIDEADGKCEICTKWSAGNESGKCCNSCAGAVASGENMAGNGYQSPRADHYHLKSVLGLNGREAIFSELCLECYRAAFTEAYPEIEVPV